MSATVLTGQLAGLAVARALGREGVKVRMVCHDPSEFARASNSVQSVLRAPHPDHNEREYVELLTADAGPQRNLLVPTSDEALGAVARNRELLERHYVVAAPPWELVRLLLDKPNTYELAEELGLPAPRTFTPRTEAEAVDDADRVGFPCLVKPSLGHLYFERFHRKMTEVGSRAELLPAYREATGAGLEVMVQELIPGDDTHGVNYNSYWRAGESLVSFTAEKVRLAPPGTGRPRVLVSKPVPEIAEPATRLLGHLGYSGFACTEFKRDARDGVYKLMEVNARHNMSTAHSLACGVNFPWIEYAHRMRGSEPAPVAQRDGLYWVDGLPDALQSARQRSRERYTLRQLARPYARPHTGAVFDRRDPAPAAARLWRRLRAQLDR